MSGGWGLGGWGESWGEPHDFTNGSFETASTVPLCGMADGWDYSALSSIELIAAFSSGCYGLESFEVDWPDTPIFAFTSANLSAPNFNIDSTTGSPGTVIFKCSLTTLENFEQGWPAPPYGSGISAGNELYAFDFASLSSTEYTFNSGTAVATSLVETFEGAWSSNESYLFNFASAASTAGTFNNPSTDPRDSFETNWFTGSYLTDFSNPALTSTVEIDGLNIKSIFTVSTNDVWAVGEKGAILHFDGTSWTSYDSGVSTTLYGVWGSTTSNVWFVGANGVVLHWDGTAMSTVETGGLTNTFYAVAGPGGLNPDVWIVGSSGKILHWDGLVLTAQTSNTAQALLAVYALSTTEVWAVGNGGAALHYTGAWSSTSTGVSVNLNGIYAAHTAAIYAVGNGGTVLFNNGAVWSTMTSGTSNALYAIHGTSFANIYAVGFNGTVLKYTGTWAAASPALSTTSSLRGVYMDSSSTVWVTGDTGRSFYFNGTTWSALNDSKSIARPQELFALLWDDEINADLS